MVTRYRLLLICVVAGLLLLTAIGIGLLWSLLTTAPDNFETIQHGMHLAEVQAALGEESAVSRTTSTINGVETQLRHSRVWQGSMRACEVSFDQADRVNGIVIENRRPRSVWERLRELLGLQAAWGGSLGRFASAGGGRRMGCEHVHALKA